MSKVMSREEAATYSLEELLSEVNETQETVRVVMEAGNEIEIKPVAAQQKTLITFDGYVPDGWKDAIYEPKR